MKLLPIILFLLFLLSCKADNIELSYPLTIRRVDCIEGTATYYLQQVNGIEEAWFTDSCGRYEVGEVIGTPDNIKTIRMPAHTSILDSLSWEMGSVVYSIDTTIAVGEQSNNSMFGHSGKSAANVTRDGIGSCAK